MKSYPALYIPQNGTLLVADPKATTSISESQLIEIAGFLGHEYKSCRMEAPGDDGDEVAIARFPNNLNFSIAIPVERLTVVMDPGHVPNKTL